MTGFGYNINGFGAGGGGVTVTMVTVPHLIIKYTTLNRTLLIR